MRSILCKACALVGLWAVAGAPALAGTNAEPRDRALRWLEARQDAADGAWHGPSPSATMLQTTSALRALQAAGRRSAAWYAGQAWLENHAATNTDTLARQLRALRPGKAKLQSSVDALLRARNGNGWGLAGRYLRDPLDSALAVAALWQAGSTPETREPVEWLRSLLTPGTQVSEAVTPGMLALLLEALAPAAASNPGLAQTLRARLAALTPASLGNASVVVRALASLAWQALQPESSASRQLLAGLRETQSANGDVAGNVLATALFAHALAQSEGPALAASGERVAIGDLALRLAINETLGHGALDELTRGDLAQLTTLDLDGRGVRSLRGLEYATNLQTFSAGDSPIEDLSPLAALPGVALQRDRTVTPVPSRSAPGPDAPPELADDNGPRAVPLLPAPAVWLLCPLALVLLLRGVRRSAQLPLLLVCLTLATQVQAATPNPVDQQALSPLAADGVKTLSQRLLQAASARPDASADQATLEATRTLVEELEGTIGRSQRVATEAAATRSSAGWSPLPAEVLERARVLIARLRQPSAAPTRGSAVNTLALALATQRAALFQRWAMDLEAALAPTVPDRMARLSALRRRLQADDQHPPRARPATPTLQALPASPR